jgi:hypothetical protein
MVERGSGGGGVTVYGSFVKGTWKGAHPRGTLRDG